MSPAARPVLWNEWVCCMRPNFIGNHYLLCVDISLMKYHYGEELWNHCTYKWNSSQVCLLPSATLCQGSAGTPSTQHMPAPEMGLPRELCSGVKQQWGERQVLYMLLKAPSWEEQKTQRDFWHGHLVHWHRYSCAKTVQRCLIDFTSGKISVSWYWYPYSAIFYVYMYI